MAPTKKRLGEILIDAGVIDEHQLASALGHQKQWGVKIGQALVDLKIATELQIVDALSKKLGYETVRLDRLEPSPVIEAALKLVPRDLARSQNLLPLASDTNSVTVAMSDPTNVAIIDELAFRTGKRVRIVIAGDREIARSVRKLYFPEESRRLNAVEVPAEVDMMVPTDWLTSSPGTVSGAHAGERTFNFEDLSSDATPPRPQQGHAAPAAPMRAEPVEARATGTPTPRPSVPAASEAVLLDVVERMLKGERAPGGLVPGRLAAAAVRILLRKGAFSEAELLAELMRK